MQTKNYIFYLFFFFIILTGCSSSSREDGTVSFVEVNGSQVMVCDMEAITKKEVLRLSELVESCELIRLEDVDEALFKAMTITVTDNYIGIRQSGKPYKLFNRSGKYLGNIGTVGQGPGEYINYMYDEIIDEKTGYIYLMPFLDKKMIIYDITGKHIKDIPLPYRMNKPKMVYDNGLFTIIQLPIYEADVFSIQMDLDGTVLQESLPPKYMFAESYTEEILSYRHSDAFEFHITTTDTLYHFDMENSRFHPVFTMANAPSSSAEKMWWLEYQELPDRFLSTFWAYENNKNTEIRAFSTHKDSQTSFSITKFVNDFYGGIEFSVWAFNKGYFIHNVEPGELIDIIDKRLAESDCTEQDRKLLTQLLSTLDENSNNLLFVGKLKQ